MIRFPHVTRLVTPRDLGKHRSTLTSLFVCWASAWLCGGTAAGGMSAGGGGGGGGGGVSVGGRDASSCSCSWSSRYLRNSEQSCWTFGENHGGRHDAKNCSGKYAGRCVHAHTHTHTGSSSYVKMVKVTELLSMCSDYED